MQAARHDQDDNRPHPLGVHNEAHAQEEEARLAHVLKDLQQPEREAHKRGTRQLRALTSVLPSASPLRAVANYFLGVCYVEAHGCSKRCGGKVL